MSVNSKIAFKKYVTPSQIIAFLQSENHEVSNYVKYDKKKYPMGYIYVNENTESTSLFYYINDNQEIFDKEKIVYLIGDTKQITIEIMKNLLRNFGGGYIDENDCDDIELDQTYIHGEYDDQWVCKLTNVLQNAGVSQVCKVAEVIQENKEKIIEILQNI